jgi:hypothetical protein
MMDDVKAVVFLFLAACGGTVSTGDDADAAPDAAVDSLVAMEASEDAVGVDVAVNDASVPPCPVACDESTFAPMCCGANDAPTLHTCSDAGVVVDTLTTCAR